LHNFCIDKSSEEIDYPFEKDVASIMMEGGFSLPCMDNNCIDAFWEYNSADRLDDLLDGKAHMDDHTPSQRRQYPHSFDKPCHKILAEVIRMGYERPDYSRVRLQEEA
jgi:hypothetical protein